MRKAVEHVWEYHAIKPQEMTSDMKAKIKEKIQTPQGCCKSWRPMRSESDFQALCVLDLYPIAADHDHDYGQ
jgi:hypothetical protein